MPKSAISSRAAGSPPSSGSGGLQLLFPALVVVTALAYLPAWHGGLVWDDDRHVTADALRSVEGLWRIWFEPGATQQYYPLTHSAFWVMARLWGDATTGYHLVNIALHAVSAGLVAVILRRLAVPGAVLAAFLFALHPVHVESVAWITELKNTLSGVLYLSAVLVYVGFDDGRARSSWWAAFGLFVLALLGKTVTATLPAVLLVVCWWRRGRLDWRRDVFPLLPFLVVGIAAGLGTAWVERVLIGAEGEAFQFTPVERGLIAGRVVTFYLSKLAWPAGLVFTYPRWEVSQAVWWQYLYPFGVLAALGLLWRLRQRTRAPLAALLIFGGTLFPVLGFFNVYPFRFSFVADHFQYLASIAVIALVSAAATEAARARIARPPARALAALVVLVPLAALTWQQSRVYADGETLYRAILERTPASWMAHSNLSMLLVADGRSEEALRHAREAARLHPGLPEAHVNAGNALQRLGRLAEATAEYREAVRADPGLAEARNNLCSVLVQLGRPDEGAGECEAAVRIDPRYPEARYNLGIARAALGRAAEAAESLREAIRLRPDYAEAHYQLGMLLLRSGRAAEAIPHFETVVRLAPAVPVARNDLGVALREAGREEEAVRSFTEAVRLRPDYADASFNLGVTLHGLGRAEEALAAYRQALTHQPADPAGWNNLGAALEALGRRQEAADAYREALRLRPDWAEARANLARVSR